MSTAEAEAAWDAFCRRFPWALVGNGIVACDVCGTDRMIYRNRLAAPGQAIYRCRTDGTITDDPPNWTVD